MPRARARVDRAAAQRVVHEPLVHRRRAAHGVVPVHVAVHLILREQQRLERRRAPSPTSPTAGAPLLRILDDGERVEQAVDVDLAVRHAAHERVALEVLDLVEVERAGDQSLQRALALAADERRARAPARSRRGASRSTVRDLAVGDQRARHLLVVQRADLLERVRERIVSHVVQQRGARAPPRTRPRSSCASSPRSLEQRERAPRRDGTCRARARSASGSRPDRRETRGRAVARSAAAGTTAVSTSRSAIRDPSRMLFQSGSRMIVTAAVRRHHPRGPALPHRLRPRRRRTSRSSSRTSRASFFACASYAAGSAQVLRGTSTSAARRESPSAPRGRTRGSRSSARSSSSPDERRAHHRARVAELHALAHAVRRRPLQPVFTSHTCESCSLEQLAEHLGVLRRMPDEEHRAEARAEGRLRLLHAALRARDLRRVAGEEVVHRLLARELRDRRQHAERVGGEEDDVLRMAAAARRDVIAGCSAAGTTRACSR